MQVARTRRAATVVRKERTFRSGPYLNSLFGAERRVDAYLQREICQRIRKARKLAGLTQEDMANLLAVTTRAYQNYERERVPFRSLSKISQITGVSQEWLLRGEVPGQANDPLLRDVAAGVALLERSAESVLGRLDDALARLERIEASLSPAAKRPARE